MLRESNPDAYKPKLISIGPYHKNNPQLLPMEKYKLMYLQRFLRRKDGLVVESCINEMEKLKYEALNCYDDIDYRDFGTVGKFSEVLLLDGCFVVEFFRECCAMVPNGEGLIMPMGCTIWVQVYCDLLLLENQLPFFILTKLYEMTMNVTDKISFIELVEVTFSNFGVLNRNPATGNIKHLLQLLHDKHCPSSDNYKMKTNMPKAEEDNKTWNISMPNATELFEAGVRFSKVGCPYDNKTSMFDIKFENGLMKIPYFVVYDHTEAELRNLIAYEQHSSDVSPKYVSQFACFMDYLIESDKDVALLRKKGIIKNETGEDSEVANLFNKLGKGVVVPRPNEFYYKEVCRKAVLHCEKPWNQMKANLRHNYFNSPWAGISTVAAIILLLLTFTQTVLSFISVLKQ